MANEATVDISTRRTARVALDLSFSEELINRVDRSMMYTLSRSAAYDLS